MIATAVELFGFTVNTLSVDIEPCEGVTYQVKIHVLILKKISLLIIEFVLEIRMEFYQYKSLGDMRKITPFDTVATFQQRRTQGCHYRDIWCCLYGCRNISKPLHRVSTRYFHVKLLPTTDPEVSLKVEDAWVGKAVRAAQWEIYHVRQSSIRTQISLKLKIGSINTINPGEIKSSWAHPFGPLNRWKPMLDL